MTGPNLLRLLVCLLITVLLVLPVGSNAPAEALRLDSLNPEEMARALATGDVTRPVVWTDSLPPGPAELALLSGATRSRGTRLSVSPGLPALALVSPPLLVAGRRSELTLTLRGPAGVDVPVAIHGPAGTVDTVVITPDPTGRATTSLSIRPTRAGGARWSATTATDTAAADTWVRPARPLRVLVLSQTPGWETRFLTRALEEAGVHVSVRQELGRDLRATSADADLPRSLEELDAVDAVLLVGWPRDAAVPALLAEWVRAGGGVLLSGSPADLGSEGPLAPWVVRGPATTVRADGLVWSGPATLVPPPAAQLDIGAWAVRAPAGAIPVATDPIPVVTEGGGAQTTVFAAAGTLGRGRVLALGLGETWRLRSEAGLVQEHRDFWLSLVEWLSGGVRSDTVLDAPLATAGLAWTGRFVGQTPASIVLHAPGGLGERIQVARTAGGAGSFRFLPASTGEYGIQVNPTARAKGITQADSVDGIPFGTVASGSAPRATRAAAVLAVGGRGGIIDLGDLGSAPTVQGPSWTGGVLPGLLFLLIAGLLATEWVWRRAGRQS